MIQNVQAAGVTESNCFISGIPGHRIEDVLLDNIRIEYAGGGTAADAGRCVPEMTADYPKPRMFGKLPAWGLFIRHASHVQLRDVTFSYVAPDYRSVILCDDVQGLEIDHLKAESVSGAAPFVRLHNTGKAVIRNVRPAECTETFLEVRGADSGSIAVFDNDLSRVARPFLLGKTVSKDAVKTRDNLF